MNGTEHIIVEDRLTGVGNHAGYLCHAYCHRGACSFDFNNGSYSMEAGDCLVVRRSDLMTNVCQSDDFVVESLSRLRIAIMAPKASWHCSTTPSCA